MGNYNYMCVRLFIIPPCHSFVFFVDEVKTETLDLARRGLKKLEKAPLDDTQGVISLILDQNELQRLDNIESYSRLENVRKHVTDELIYIIFIIVLTRTTTPYFWCDLLSRSFSILEQR